MQIFAQLNIEQHRAMMKMITVTLLLAAGIFENPANLLTWLNIEQRRITNNDNPGTFFGQRNPSLRSSSSIDL